MEIVSGKNVRLGGGKPAGTPLWSSDGKWIAFRGVDGDNRGLLIARPDGTETTFLAAMTGTNSPLPEAGKDVAWSPDGKQIAFVSSTPGEESAEAGGDPMVITRYLYKPDAGEGMTHTTTSGYIFLLWTWRRQLTQGKYDDHSIDWSPDGKRLVFASNHEPNQDEFLTTIYLRCNCRITASIG
jgi:WD40-like Beta Propeller Repeat